MNKLAKSSFFIIGSLLILLIIAILIASPAAKYLIEKYDEQYTGRNITLNKAYVNPLTGYVYLY